MFKEYIVYPVIPEELASEFLCVFSEELGTYKSPPVTFQIDPTILHICLKVWNVAFTLKPKINELDWLIAQEVMESATHSALATPIVPVFKPNGNVRIYGYYMCTVNKAFKQGYPDLVINQFSILAGEKLFAFIGNL